MDLAQHTDCGQAVEVGGRTLAFSELTLDALGRLQKFLKDTVSHPLRALAGQLDGFDPESKEILLRQAREDAQHWPPEPGSVAFARHLFGSRAGHLALLGEAAKAHHGDEPGLAAWVYDHIKNDGPLSRTITRILFGMDPDPGPDAEGEGDAGNARTGAARSTAPPTGTSSSGPASNA